MKKKLIIVIIYALIQTSFVLLLSEDTSNTGDCSSEGCHKDKISFITIHSPAESDCSSCHESNGSEHPTTSGIEFKLTSEQPTLCYGCHDEKGKAKFKHSPFEIDVCTSCHNPHGSNTTSLLNVEKNENICKNCHDLTDEKKSILHSPFENQQCVDCHNPHESDNKKLLKKPAPMLCYDCHSYFSEMSKLKSVHSPFSDDCSNCHEPHLSSKLSLLKESGSDLCYTCHSDMKSTVESAKVIHKPLIEKMQCKNCHNPHASTNSSLLEKPENDLCISCHNKEIKSGTRILDNIKRKLKFKFQHQPVSDDRCSACHNPHSSKNNSLLNEQFENNHYVTGVVKSFQLCFNCHDSQLLEAQKTTNATEFRNGNINLHYLHVNKDKGRNCNLCHDVHGAENSKLIKNEVLFGSWMMPIKFKSSELGGTCAPGCHKPLTYNRSISKEYFAAILKGKINIDNGKTKMNLSGLKLSIKNSDGKFNADIPLNNDLSFRVENIEPGEYILSIDPEKMKLLGFYTDKPKISVNVKNDTNSSIIENLILNYYTITDTTSLAKNLTGKLKADLIDNTKETVTNISKEDSTSKSKENDIKIQINPEENLIVSFDGERSAILTTEIKGYLQKYITILKANPKSKISIIGHTDNRGTFQQNEKLSFERANTAANYLINKGISKKRIYVHGQGSLYPLEKNNTPAGRKKNNRLEIKIVK